MPTKLAGVEKHLAHRERDRGCRVRRSESSSTVRVLNSYLKPPDVLLSFFLFFLKNASTWRLQSGGGGIAPDDGIAHVIRLD